MMTKLNSSSSKIPVRDLKSMFDTMEQRSCKETFAASFNPPSSAVAAEKRSKSVDKTLKLNEKNKELKHLINVKDTQIHELRMNTTKLKDELEKLQRDKMILMDNYNSLMEKNEESLSEEKSKIEFLEKENAEVKNDLKMLKILVFRLNKHIEYYQEMLNEKEMKFDAPTTYEHEEDTTSTWSVHSNILSPLMNSYEERIKEKNDIIKSYETELSQFTVKLKKILDENERIQELYETHVKNADIWLTEKQRLMSQNEILRHKATIHAKRADLAKEKLCEVLKVYEQKMQSQSLDIDRLQEAYNRSKGEITTLKSMHKNPDEFTQQLKECQQMFEDFRMQFEVEKSQMIDDKKNIETQLNHFKDRVNELETLLEKQKLCNEALSDKNKMLKKAFNQERQSRENIEKEANQFRQYGRDTLQNISDLQNILQEKDLIISNLRCSHQNAIEEYEMKLQQRDHTLRKVLEAKMAQSSTKC